MKAAAFEELLTSVRQAGEIRRGRRKPARDDLQADGREGVAGTDLGYTAATE